MLVSGQTHREQYQKVHANLAVKASGQTKWERNQKVHALHALQASIRLKRVLLLTHVLIVKPEDMQRHLALGSVHCVMEERTRQPKVKPSVSNVVVESFLED